MELFKLMGSIFIDTDDADKSMSKTTEQAEKMSEKIGKGAKTVAKVGAATIAATTAVTGALISNAKETSNTADVIDKASIRMGISAEKYQELAYAAGQSGVEMSTLEKAAKKLDGTGINIDDAIKSIMSLETAEERAAKASELFGDAVAYQMTPLIEQSGESFNGLIDRANELGLVMSEDAIKSGVEFGDLMSDLENSTKMLGASLGSAMMPVLNEVVKILVDNMPEIQKMIQDLAPVFSDLIAQVIPPLLELLQTILPPLIAIIKTVLPIVVGVVNGIIGAIKTAVSFVGDAIGSVKGFFDDMIAFIEGVVEAIKSPINAVIGGINSMFSALSLDIPDWIPIIGGNSISLPQIPMLAKGGTITGGGSVIVGEKGPELLNLNSGASVVPLNSNDGLGSVVNAIEESANNVINAIKYYSGSSTIKIEDPYRIFKLVKDEERKYNTVVGRA